jgi:hypothetical protein
MAGVDVTASASQSKHDTKKDKMISLVRYLRENKLLDCIQSNDILLDWAIAATSPDIARKVKTIPTVERLEQIGASDDKTVDCYDGSSATCTTFWRTTDDPMACIVVEAGGTFSTVADNNGLELDALESLEVDVIFGFEHLTDEEEAIIKYHAVMQLSVSVGQKWPISLLNRCHEETPDDFISFDDSLLSDEIKAHCVKCSDF